MKKLLVVIMLTSMVFFSVGCEKNNVDTKQNTTVEDSSNEDTSETIDSEKMIKEGGTKRQYFRRKARDEDIENLLCE